MSTLRINSIDIQHVGVLELEMYLELIMLDTVSVNTHEPFRAESKPIYS